MFIQTNDIFIEEISTRFEPKNLKPLISFYNLVVVDKIPENINCVLKDLEIYEELFSKSKLLIELDMYYKIKEAKELNSFDKILGALKYRDFLVSFISSFSNIFTLIKIYLSSPIANVTSERAFSGLKRVKTYLRSVMTQDRLSSMSILNIENENLSLIYLNEAIDEFAAKKERRLLFH